MNNIKKLNLLSGVVVLGLLGVPLGAHAVQITLGPTADGITLTAAGGGIVGVSIAAGTSGPTFEFGGTYTFGGATFNAGPNVAEQYAAAANSELFTFTGGGNSITGNLVWNFLQDNTPNPKFFGTLTITASSGSPGFVSTWFVGAHDPIDLTAQSLGQTLDQLAASATGSHVTVGVSSGELTAVPGPIVGAGMPGLVAACGGLLALARRRRQKIA